MQQKNVRETFRKHTDSNTKHNKKKQTKQKTLKTYLQEKTNVTARQHTEGKNNIWKTYLKHTNRNNKNIPKTRNKNKEHARNIQRTKKHTSNTGTGKKVNGRNVQTGTKNIRNIPETYKLENTIFSIPSFLPLTFCSPPWAYNDIFFWMWFPPWFRKVLILRIAKHDVAVLENVTCMAKATDVIDCTCFAWRSIASVCERVSAQHYST